VSATHVSAIMCVRDGERYIDDAIGSMLGQTVPPDEVVVVDDGSTDGSAAIAQGHGDPVRVIRQDPLGQAAAINSALEVVTGELISFLDADDLWTLRKLEVQREALDRSRNLDAVFGHVEEFISPDLEREERAQLRPVSGPVPAKLKGTMMIRRNAMRRAGPFATGWKVAEFVDWYARAQDAGFREEMLDELVLRRRLHLMNVGRRHKASRGEYAAVMAAHLQRRKTREDA
jgi:glycosyltransferase involved in cell wall biosynthesis